MNREPTIWLLLACLCAASAAPAAEGAAPSKPAQLHYVRGVLYENAGALPQALAQYEDALKRDPGSIYLARQAAEAALELGSADKALDWAEAVEKAEPGDPDGEILLGRVLWARGDAEKAEEAFQRALKLDPDSVESALSLSALMSGDEPAKAKKLLERFIERDPDHAAEARFQIAKIDLQEGDAAGARKQLRQSIDIEPDESSLPARYALAQSYEVDHDTQAALKEYLEIANLEPDNVALLDHIGETDLEQDDEAAAKAAFSQAKRVQGSDPSANHWLAAIAEKDGDFAAAAAYLEASAALPEEPALNLRLSYYLTQAGRLPDAVQVLERAHARWPNNDQVSYFLALGYDDMKQDDKALKLLRRVVAVKPDYREARFQLGVILEKLDKMDEAERQFRALLADTPDDAAVLNYLGYSLADRGLKLAEAAQLIRKAVDLDPQNGAYRDSLGWVDYKEGRSTAAVSELLAALRLMPNDDTVWEHVGDAESAAGNRREAWLAWMRSQALAQDATDAGKKARREERRLGSAQTGQLYQDYLSYSQNALRKLDGLCKLSGSVLGHAFSYDAMVHFKAPDRLSIDLLGPFYTPLLTMKLENGKFSSPPIRIPGVPPQNAYAAGAASLSAISEYLSGRVFALSPARFRRTFWRRRGLVNAGGWTLELNDSETLAWRLRPPAGPVKALELGDFGRDEGRFVPKTITVAGSGFRFALDFTDVKIDLAPETVPIPVGK